MNILHFSDHEDSEQLANLFDQCDILFSTGDLSSFSFRSIRDLIYKKPSFGVYGDHDAPTYLEALGIQNLHLKTFI